MIRRGHPPLTLSGVSAQVLKHLRAIPRDPYCDPTIDETWHGLGQYTLGGGWQRVRASFGGCRLGVYPLGGPTTYVDELDVFTTSLGDVLTTSGLLYVTTGGAIAAVGSGCGDLGHGAYGVGVGYMLGRYPLGGPI